VLGNDPLLRGGPHVIPHDAVLDSHDEEPLVGLDDFATGKGQRENALPHLRPWILHRQPDLFAQLADGRLLKGLTRLHTAPGSGPMRAPGKSIVGMNEAKEQESLLRVEDEKT